MPIAVVGRALLRVGEHGIGLAAFLEALLGVGIAGIAIRMMLHGELSVGTLDFLIARRTRDAQDFVVIAFYFGGQWRCPKFELSSD